MAILSAAQQSQLYTELTEATSQATAEVIMHSLIDTPWDNLVTNDHLDARFAGVDVRFAEINARFSEVDARFSEVDARFARLEGHMDARFAEMNAQIERSLQANTFRILTTMFAFNGALVAVMAALR